MVTRRAFTLIELLVVVVIMALLAGLVVLGAGALGIGSKRAKTETVLRQGLELTAAERGSLVTAAEHPLAGSAPPRTAFLRAAGGAVATTGEALRGVDPAQVVAAAADRVLAATDRLADPDIPMLYALPRADLGVIGVPQAGVTRYRLLPRGTTTATDVTAAGYVEVGNGVAADHLDLLQSIYGATGLQAELVKLGAWQGDVPAYRHPLRGGRVVSDVQAGSAGVGATRWAPGMIGDGVHPEASGARNWKAYRLPGVAIVDAWGREVLYGVTLGGALRLMSAGQDGAFVVDPGPDGAIQTPVGSPPQGDDDDATRDNIRYSAVD